MDEVGQARRSLAIHHVTTLDAKPKTPAAPTHLTLICDTGISQCAEQSRNL
jgi:hypothetical protein